MRGWLGWLGCGLVVLALGTALALVFLGDLRVYAPPPTVVVPSTYPVGGPPPPPIFVPAWQITTLGLSVVAIPLAVAGAIIGLLDRRTKRGRIVTIGGLVAALLNFGAVALEFGRAIVGFGGGK